jgi:GNAT superfamily N-acetyltransferase
VLSRLFVSGDVRGRGVGSALLDAVDAWADAHGRDLRLVVLDQDAAARRLYERRGWQHTGSDPADWLGGAGPWPVAHAYGRPHRTVP